MNRIGMAEEIFESALSWLRTEYSSFKFYVERDVVWTLQQRLQQEVDSRGAALRVFNDYPIAPSKRRSLGADLVLLRNDRKVELAIEFKYEPSHHRDDLLPSKLPVVFWGKDGVGKDVERIKTFVDDGRADAAQSVFIDEGGAFRHRDPHPGSSWVSWDNGVWVLRARACRVD